MGISFIIVHHVAKYKYILGISQYYQTNNVTIIIKH